MKTKSMVNSQMKKEKKSSMYNLNNACISILRYTDHF